MRDLSQLYYATNLELRDLLLSAKQKITESVLHELLRDRGMICSPHDSRETLAERLSMLPHDYADVCGILDRREATKRGEKTSTIRINADISPQELKEIVEDYQGAASQERVSHHQRGTEGFVMNVTYSDYDYSKTRLLQRQDRNATIEFEKQGDRIELRLPATEKARAIVEDLKTRIEAKKRQVVTLDEIELTEITSAEDRTTFFTRLISTLPQFTLMNVSRLRVSHANVNDEEGIDIDSDEVEEAAEQMAGVVENVAISGENLVASEMYQELKTKGFFITSITWRSKQTVDPYSIVEFDAGFEDKQAAKRFRYSVHGALRFKSGSYTKNIRPVSDTDKATLLGMIEVTARRVLEEVSGAASDAEGDRSSE